MDYYLFHWVWYLLGIMFVPKLTIAIVLSIYGKDLHLPIIIMIIVWLKAIGGIFKINKKGVNNG